MSMATRVFWARTTRSLPVWITMPGSIFRWQEGTSVRAPSTSTAHTRHTPTGSMPGWWQSLGISTPIDCAASQMVAPASASIFWPSMVIVIVFSSGIYQSRLHLSLAMIFRSKYSKSER